VIAKALGRTPKAVNAMAAEMDLRKTAKGRTTAAQFAQARRWDRVVATRANATSTAEAPT
jgi:hypothetical protein